VTSVRFRCSYKGGVWVSASRSSPVIYREGLIPYLCESGFCLILGEKCQVVEWKKYFALRTSSLSASIYGRCEDLT